MKGDTSLFRHAKLPYLALLVTAVGAGSGYLIHILRNNPTIVLRNKKENPCMF